MLYYLQLEWKKIRKYNVFIVLSLAYLVMLPSIYLIGKTLPELPPPLIANEQLFQLPMIWDYLAYLANWLAFYFLGFLSIIIVTSEFGNKTLRQNIITGLERSDVFWSKFTLITVIALVATLHFALIGYGFGLTHTDFDLVTSAVLYRKADIIGRFFLACMGYMSLGFLIGMLTRRMGISTILYFVYVLLELIIRWLVHFRIVENKTMHFYPIKGIGDLLPIPFSEQAEFFTKQYGFSLTLEPMEAVITVIVYTVLFFFLAYRLLTKRDL